MHSATPRVAPGGRLSFRFLPAGALFLLLALAASSGASAQGAIDPSVAPRAAALERAGDRRTAINLLGRYLATAPDDGQARFTSPRICLELITSYAPP